MKFIQDWMLVWGLKSSNLVQVRTTIINLGIIFKENLELSKSTILSFKKNLYQTDQFYQAKPCKVYNAACTCQQVVGGINNSVSGS